MRVPRLLTVPPIIAILVSSVALSGPKPKVSHSLKKDALRSVDLGLRWLRDKQADDGHWSLGRYPAVTALVAWAYLRGPARPQGEIAPHVRKALAYIESRAHKDGSIYRPVDKRRGGPLRNYNTAICMAALAASCDVRYDGVVRRARDFLIRGQRLRQGVYYGGMGYDADFERNYADMNNTYVAVEAVKFTTFVVASKSNSCSPPITAADLRVTQAQEKKPDYNDLNWKAAVAFLERCQNRPTGDPAKPVSLDLKDRGGFFYKPTEGKAGAAPDAYGKRAWRSHGTSTYSGILCFLYANLTLDDPRVVDAVDWARRNFTLEEHPGLGRQGLYFYYHTMAKALCVYGEEPLKLADGRLVDWRTELVKRLVSLQRIEPGTGLGYWVNDVGRWMENDPVLVTAYSVLALETLLSGVAP